MHLPANHLKGKIKRFFYNYGSGLLIVQIVCSLKRIREKRKNSIFNSCQVWPNPQHESSYSQGREIPCSKYPSNIKTALCTGVKKKLFEEITQYRHTLAQETFIPGSCKSLLIIHVSICPDDSLSYA